MRSARQPPLSLIEYVPIPPNQQPTVHTLLKLLSALLLVALGCASPPRAAAPPAAPAPMAGTPSTQLATLEGLHPSSLKLQAPTSLPSSQTTPAAPNVAVESVESVQLEEPVGLVAHEEPPKAPDPAIAPIAPVELETLPVPKVAVDRDPVMVADVISSIHATFPLLAAAYQENRIAAGNQVASWGAFDTKLKASSENGPLGFYEQYRTSAGFTRPIYQGGDVFGGYRIGRGSFQPWYLERQTNDAGEFKAGVNIPLWKNREIDARRAQLWRSTYHRQRAAPEIRSQLIQFVRDGSIAYWQWIAAVRQLEVGVRALELAQRRNEQLKMKEQVGDIDPPVLQDNLGAIARREAKVIDLRRKVRQSAFKLSLFYRSPDGEPLPPHEWDFADFPKPSVLTDEQVQRDVVNALAQRPELAALDAARRAINVDLAEARNDMLPAVNALFVGSQDVGEPTSSKRDKSEFELEAGVFVDVPMQRRKGRGKSQAARAKLAQIAAKRQFTSDKIGVEVQLAHAAWNAAFERLGKAQEAKRLAEYMADVERRKFDVGQSDLLSVVLREQYAIEAAESEIDALLEYFTARADHSAALARDWPEY